MSAAPPAHLLRLLLSCRSVSAQVTFPATSTIIAMASSREQEFITQHRARISRFPRSRALWDARTAARVGEKLGLRLVGAGVAAVEIDLDEELARPAHFRRPCGALFESVERAGVRVDGAEKLLWP